MLRPFVAVALSFAFVGLSGTYARADEAQAAQGGAAANAEHGLAVLGLGASADVAWPLARAVYFDAGLRPPTLDEAHARVLVGEAPEKGATAELRDLSDSRVAIHGDDAASRRLLASIAQSMHVKGIVVVEAGSSPELRPVARVFVTDSNAYDPVRYEADPPAPVTWGNGSSLARWEGTVQALHRGFAGAPPVAAINPPPGAIPVGTSTVSGPAGVLHLAPANASSTNPAEASKSGRSFYQSPWFWAAAGAALFAAGAVYFATRNDSADNIQLQVSVPK